MRSVLIVLFAMLTIGCNITPEVKSECTIGHLDQKTKDKAAKHNMDCVGKTVQKGVTNSANIDTIIEECRLSTQKLFL